MKRWLRSIAWLVAPWFMADRAVRWSASVQRREGFWEEISQVTAGPFSGLAYPADVRPWIGAPTLKRGGVYERSMVDRLVGLLVTATAFVDVGASDGYYAIGVAMTGLPTVAYESSRIQRRNLRAIAAANDVRLTVRGHCRRLPELGAGSLMLIDVEGAEADLVDGRAVAGLRRASLVIELHEEARPGVTALLQSRLAASHDVELVVGDPEPLRNDGTVWAICRPRA